MAGGRRWGTTGPPVGGAVQPETTSAGPPRRRARARTHTRTHVNRIIAIRPRPARADRRPPSPTTSCTAATRSSADRRPPPPAPRHTLSAPPVAPPLRSSRLHDRAGPPPPPLAYFIPYTVSRSRRDSFALTPFFARSLDRSLSLGLTRANRSGIIRASVYHHCTSEHEISH